MNHVPREKKIADMLKKRGDEAVSSMAGSTHFDKVGYSANLQQAIEYHCRGQIIPAALAKLCPHHAHMLNVDLSNK